MRSSMSRRGDCWDNAPTESLWDSLKVARLHGQYFPTQRAAMDEIVDWLGVYNRLSNCKCSRSNVMTTSPEIALEVVQEFWRLMATNDFYAVATVLADDFVLDWPQSKERIRGAANFAGLNTAYPAQGPWVFTINRVVANGHDAVSDVCVTDGALSARAISFFTVEGGKISHIQEFWPQPYEAPFDRTQFVERLE